MQRSELPRTFRTGELLGSTSVPNAIPVPGEAAAGASSEHFGGSVTPNSMQPFRASTTASTAESALLSLLAAQTAPSSERVTRLVRGLAPDANSQLIATVQSAVADSTTIPQLFHAAATALASTFDVGCAVVVSASRRR